VKPSVEWIRASRFDRVSLDTLDFPMVIDVPVRFDDLDTQNHVNNAAAAVILQEGRIDFNRRATMPALAQGLRPAIVALRIEFAAELRYPGMVQVATGVVAIGRTSFTLLQIGRQDGRSALYGEFTLVVSGLNGPVPLPEELRGAMERLCVVSG
jgi:acyl-CoA thioester hydrolase